MIKQYLSFPTMTVFETKSYITQLSENELQILNVGVFPISDLARIETRSYGDLNLPRLFGR